MLPYIHVYLFFGEVESLMVYYLIFTAIISYILIKIIIIYSDKLNLIDVPGERSVHTKIRPHGAGIGFVAAILIGMFFYDSAMLIKHWYLSLSIIMVLVVGIIDDVWEVQPKTKIIIIMTAILPLWLNGLGLKTLGVYFSYDIQLGFLELPFMLIALVGFTNALNLIDGIDGLAGMVSFVIIGSFGYIAYQNLDVLLLMMTAFSMASLLAFLLLNYHPAKIFMGDSGSLTLGFIIVIIALVSLKYIHPIVVLYFTALPIFDTLTVIRRRLKHRIHIFQPDKTHFHHLLLEYFGDRDENGQKINGNRRTAWVLTLAQVLFSLVGIWLHTLITNDNYVALTALVVLIAVFFIIYELVKKIEALTRER